MNSARWKRLALLLAAALALRLGAGAYWQWRLEGGFAMPDSESYWALGRAIAEGRPYQFGPEPYRVFRTPGYPLLLAPIFLIADGGRAVMLARAEAALLGTAAVAAVWWLARSAFDERIGLIAAALAAVYPEEIALSSLVLSEAPFCPLVLANLSLWIAAWRAESAGRAGVLACCAGLTAGVAALMRPSWLLFTPLAILVGVVVGAPSSRPSPGGRGDDGNSEGDSPIFAARKSGQSPGAVRLRHAWLGALMLAGLAMAMLPWWIRNARATGCFVPTTLQVGASLYDGLNPEATGASNMDFVPKFVEMERRESAQGQPQAQESLEVRLDRRLRTESLAWAEAHPGRVLQLAGAKLLRIGNIWPNEPRLSSWPVRLAVVLTYVPVLILAVLGAMRTIGWGWPYILCWLPAVYFSGLHAVFVSSIRYRGPAMLGLIVLAAAVLGGLPRDRSPGAFHSTPTTNH